MVLGTRSKHGICILLSTLKAPNTLLSSVTKHLDVGYAHVLKVHNFVFTFEYKNVHFVLAVAIRCQKRMWWKYL